MEKRSRSEPQPTLQQEGKEDQGKQDVTTTVDRVRQDVRQDVTTMTTTTTKTTKAGTGYGNSTTTTTGYGGPG